MVAIPAKTMAINRTPEPIRILCVAFLLAAVKTDVFFDGFNQPAPINARKPNCCSIERDSNLVLKASRYSVFSNNSFCKRLRILTYSFG